MAIANGFQRGAMNYVYLGLNLPVVVIIFNVR